MYIHERVINGKTITINIHEEEYIKKNIKKAIELSTTVPMNQQRLTIQGKQLDGVGTMKNYNIAKAATVELTVNLQEWTKSEPCTPMETAEERQAERRASEPCSDINDLKFSHVSEHPKRAMDTPTKKSIQHMELASISTEKWNNQTI